MIDHLPATGQVEESEHFILMIGVTLYSISSQCWELENPITINHFHF